MSGYKQTKQPVFTAFCDDGDCCTSVEQKEDHVIVANHLGQQVQIPQEEWEQIKQAVKDGRL